MDMHADILSFLDLLDLDEEIIDSRLKSIMLRSNHTNLHLTNAIQLLQYKNLINTQENSDCDNNIEYDFTIQLLGNLNDENVDYISKIIYIVLCLNTTNIINKSEHLIQQILFNLDLYLKKIDRNTVEGEATSKIFLDLKICESVLDALIVSGEKVPLLFLNTPLEEILGCTNEKLKLYFISNIVPKLFEGVIGYNILDRIWNYIKQSKEEMNHNSLQILSCLADYYLPTPDMKGKIKYESEIIYLCEFWDIVLYGMVSDDSSTRKISVYLSKRAVDYVLAMKKDICVQTEKHTIFRWIKSNSKHFKNMWDNYFTLIDSLEEKQSNIVLPSLKLFESLSIEECWLNAAFNIGLKHDSTQVRLKCIEYRLMHKIKDRTDALVLLEAFNDTNIYDHIINYTVLKMKMANLLIDHVTLLEILKVIPAVKWSPVPFYFITDVLSNLEVKVKYDIADTITNILKVSCTNVAIRKAAYCNIAQFINNCVENLNWKDIIIFYSIIQHHSPTSNPLDSKFKNISLNDETVYSFFKYLSQSSSNVDLILYYLSEHRNYLNTFIDILNRKVSEVHDIVNRQYSNKSACLENVILLLNLISKTKDNENVSINILYEFSARQNKILFAYILSLFSSDIKLTIDVCDQLFEKNDYKFIGEELGDSLLQLYKTSILCLKDVPELDKAVLSIFALKMLLKHPILNNKYRHEMISLPRFLEIVSDFKFKDPHNQKGIGRWKNVFYEKTCEIIYLFVEEENDVKLCLKQLIKYLENILECGGYGCLKWILKTVNKIIRLIVNEEKFNITQFLNKVWNEIEELKANNQYSPCIEEFVQLITQDSLLEKAVYNNIIILYCNRIIEYGPIKTNPLYYLTLKLNKIHVTEYSLLVYVLLDIMLYCPMTRKDDRITNNLSLQILQDSTYGIDQSSLDVHFNYEIQFLSIKSLCSINEEDTLNLITKLLRNKIDEYFRNKQRYHGGSQPHKMLQLALQHILMISLKNCGNLEWLGEWCLDLLVKLPHQPSVRICLEWLVALYFHVMKTKLNEEIPKILKDKNTPLTSQFFILYWLLKYKIANSTFNEEEYEFVLDFLLSHTMGQLFNVRLSAQYLATVLHKMVKKSNKFDYTIEVIEKTFEDSKADKSLAKLKDDYFANNFDLITNLNPCFVYYLLPKYCEYDANEKVDIHYVKSILKDVVKNIIVDENFKNEWIYNEDGMEEFIVHSYIENDNKIVDGVAELGTIQKKYIPWRNMCDINVYDAGKKVVSSSDLIVVASLIDKLPNLGGMARTSEVFGVETYVVDSLRHLQDKQFQGLSVSAERWINIEEVRPGPALKEYLLQKKTKGYSVVAAEQTSTSSKLQTFKFPKKTLLLLGHEKEGVPYDLLPLMDHCVEIPQQGFVRSLNVHVTAAIFIWEYARQNVL